MTMTLRRAPFALNYYQIIFSNTNLVGVSLGLVFEESPGRTPAGASVSRLSAKKTRKGFGDGGLDLQG